MYIAIYTCCRREDADTPALLQPDAHAHCSSTASSPDRMVRLENRRHVPRLSREEAIREYSASIFYTLGLITMNRGIEYEQNACHHHSVRCHHKEGPAQKKHAAKCRRATVAHRNRSPAEAVTTTAATAATHRIYHNKAAAGVQSEYIMYPPRLHLHNTEHASSHPPTRPAPIETSLNVAPAHGK
jgi:hypothetical protein